MECCGRTNYMDYSFKGYFPTSCCKNPQDCRYETVFKKGCKEAFVGFWDKNADIIKFAGLVIAAIEVCISNPYNICILCKSFARYLILLHFDFL